MILRTLSEFPRLDRLFPSPAAPGRKGAPSRRQLRLFAGSVALTLAISMPSLSATPPPGADPQAQGLAVAEEADRRDSGFGDTVAHLEMVLRNRRGDESRRELQVKTMEQPEDGDKSLVFFDYPADIRDTALLTFSHKDGLDDQWLYLPALKRVKRISSSNKSGPFVGSEFAYEDLSSQEVEEFTYRFVREEALQGAETFVIERFPVDKKSGYSRQRVWIDQAEYRTLKVEFYDRKGSLLKTLEIDGYRLYLDRFWRPEIMRMVNHQSGKSTDLVWSEYRFRTGLTPGDFDRSTLDRPR